MNEQANNLNPEILDQIATFTGEDAETAIPSQMPVPVTQPMQQVKTNYVTAVQVQNPRSLPVVVKNVLLEAQLAGAAFYYMWQVNKKGGGKATVQGPSIDLAMSCARNYGNCGVDMDVQETESHYLFKASFIDLETGFTFPRLFRQRKGQNISAKMDAERAEDIVFQIGQSKAQRNAITKVMPKWLIDKAIEVARAAEVNKVKPENIHLARANVISFFEKHGITKDRIENVLQASADDWTAEQIADLRGTATAINDGRMDPNVAFPPITSETSKSGDGTSQKSTPSSDGSPGEIKTPGMADNQNAIDAFIKKWRRLKSGNMKDSGYHAWILQNIKTIQFYCAGNPGLLLTMKNKYHDIYGGRFPWPLDDQFQLASLASTNADTGASSSEDEGMDQGGKGPENANGEAENGNSADDQAESGQKEEKVRNWQPLLEEIAALKTQWPDFYKAAVKDLDMNTYEGLKEAIDRIELLIQERKEADTGLF